MSQTSSMCTSFGRDNSKVRYRINSMSSTDGTQCSTFPPGLVPATSTYPGRSGRGKTNLSGFGSSRLSTNSRFVFSSDFPVHGKSRLASSSVTTVSPVCANPNYPMNVRKSEMYLSGQMQPPTQMMGIDFMQDNNSSNILDNQSSGMIN